MTINEAVVKNLESTIRDNERELENLREDIRNKKLYFKLCMFIAILFFITTLLTVIQREEWKESHNKLNEEWKESYNKLKKDAITQGYAQYNPTNGIWEWKR